MLQKTYSIYSDDLNDVQLFIEAGKSYFACWCKKKDDTVLRAFEFFQCNAYDAENTKEIFDDIKLHSRLLTMPVIKTYFFWNTDEVLCLPKQYNDETFLKENFALFSANNNDSKILSQAAEDCLVAWQLKFSIEDIARQYFPVASFSHAYVSLLVSSKKANAVFLFFVSAIFYINSIQRR